MIKIKTIFQKIVILIVVIEILVSTMSVGISYAYTKEEVGNAIAGFAEHDVDTYGKEGKNIVGYRQGKGDKYDNAEHVGEPGHTRYDNPCWTPSTYSWSSPYIYFDCSSFANGCYKYVAGMDIPTGITVCSQMVKYPSYYKEYFDEIPWNNNISVLKPGDICVWSLPDEGHAFIYVNNSKGYANNGSYWSSASGYASKRGNDNWHVFRISDSGASKITNLNTEFSSTGTSSGTGIMGETVNYSNFFFNGIPDGKYSLATRESIFKIFINAIKELVNFFTGLITYLFRGLIIGIISVFDRLINNTIESVSNSPKTIEESGVRAKEADDPISMDRSVTIEGLIFGEVDLFDINIFKID